MKREIVFETSEKTIHTLSVSVFAGKCQITLKGEQIAVGKSLNLKDTKALIDWLTSEEVLMELLWKPK